MTATLSTKAWEGDYRSVLRADTLAELFGPFGGGRRQLVLNRVEARESAAALADKLLAAGHLDAWAWAEDMWPGVAAELGVPVTWFGHAWPYSAPELCELALARTPVVAHLAGDVRLLPGEPWLPRALAALDQPGVAAASPRSPTGVELTEAASRELSPGWRGTHYFSDQCFVVRREELLSPIVVRAVHPSAGRYPRPGGALTFEARVGAWLHSTGKWRAMDVERGYLHPVSGTEGDTYVLSSGVPELLAELPEPSGYPSPGSVDATAVVVARDCERTVGAAIRSLQWCARLHVGDLGSVDRTAAVAREAGAQVVRVEDHDEAVRGLDGWIVRIDGEEVVPPALAQRLAQAMPGAGAVWCPRRTWVLGEEDLAVWPDPVRIAWRTDGAGRVRHLPADRALALVRFGPAGIGSWLQHAAELSSVSALGAVIDRRAPARIALKAALQAGLRGRLRRSSRAASPGALAVLESWLWSVKASEAAAGGETAALAHYDEVAAAVLSGRHVPRVGGGA